MIAVIAHRGGRSLAPENTLAAFRRAIELGVDYVEIDVRATRDGRLVLMHDRTVDRTTDGSGAVEDLDFESIRRLDAGGKFSTDFAGEHVPTLEDVLDLCRGAVKVYLDHKDGPCEQIVRAVRGHGMEDQLVVYGGVGTLLEWKRLAPLIPVMPSLPAEYRRVGGIAAFLKLLPAEVLDGNLMDWSKDGIDEAHEAGCKVYVDTLGSNDHPNAFARAVEMGVDGIQTDFPDRLLDYLVHRSSSAV